VAWAGLSLLRLPCPTLPYPAFPCHLFTSQPHVSSRAVEEPRLAISEQLGVIPLQVSS